MDNNFEKNLKDLIKTNIQIPDDVNTKIQNTYKKIGNANKPFNIKKLTSIAASLILVVTLGGNIWAYSQNKDNIFSWILQALNIEKEYNNNSQLINKSSQSDKTTITITDAGLDNNTLIVGYHVITDKNLNNTFILNGEKRIVYENTNINLLYKSCYEQFNNQIITKISDNEYIVYEMFDVSAYQLADNFTLITNINSIDNYITNGASEFLYENNNSIQGNWDFKIDISKHNNALKSSEYAINDFSITLDDGEVIELVNANISNITTSLTFYQGQYEMAHYTVELIDSNDNIILEKNLRTLSGGISKILTRTLDTNETITINIYKYDLGSNKIVQGSKKFNLSTYGKTNNNENKFSYSKTIFKDIILELPSDWKAHDYSADKPSRMLIDIKRKINNNRSTYDTDIRVTAYNYTEDFKNKYSLEELNDILQICLSLDYILTDEFNIYIHGTNDECVLSYNEVKDLINDKIKNISKNGKTINKDTLRIVEGFKILSSNKTKIGNIEAYKTVFSSNYEDTKEVYLFIYKNNIYQINISLSSYCIDEIQNIIKTINFN